VLLCIQDRLGPRGRRFVCSARRDIQAATAPAPIAARFAVRVDPLPGEPIDSWLEATARHMDVPLGSIIRILGLPAALGPPWITCLAPNQIDVVASVTGISSSVVASMILGAYDGAALKLDPTTHRLDAAFPFGGHAFAGGGGWVGRSRACGTTRYWSTTVRGPGGSGRGVARPGRSPT
jgi:hypothetical protein